VLGVLVVTLLHITQNCFYFILFIFFFYCIFEGQKIHFTVPPNNRITQNCFYFILFIFFFYCILNLSENPLCPQITGYPQFWLWISAVILRKFRKNSEKNHVLPENLSPNHATNKYRLPGDDNWFDSYSGHSSPFKKKIMELLATIFLINKKCSFVNLIVLISIKQLSEFSEIVAQSYD